MKNTRSN